MTETYNIGRFQIPSAFFFFFFLFDTTVTVLSFQYAIVFPVFLVFVVFIVKKSKLLPKGQCSWAILLSWLVCV